MKYTDIMTNPEPQNTNLPPAIIFDFDGTLIDVRECIVHIDYEDDIHLTAYHHATVSAPANENVLALLKETIEAGIYPIVLTARGERWYELTHGIITSKGFHVETLLMRAEGDQRPDAIIKAEILAKIRETWRVVAALDDNPSVVALWESEAIPTISIPSAYSNGDPRDLIVPEWWHEVIAENTVAPRVSVSA